MNDRITALGTFREEAKVQRDAVVDVEESGVLGIRISTGHYGNLSIVHALASQGMDDAAMTATLVVDHFGWDIVLLSAIAGSLNPGLSLGDVVISERTMQCECGQVLSEGFRVWGTWDPFTESENPLYFPGDSCILEAVGDIEEEVALRDAMGQTSPVRARVVEGTVASSDKIIQNSAKGNPCTAPTVLMLSTMNAARSRTRSQPVMRTRRHWRFWTG